MLSQYFLLKVICDSSFNKTFTQFNHGLPLDLNEATALLSFTKKQRNSWKDIMALCRTSRFTLYPVHTRSRLSLFVTFPHSLLINFFFVKVETADFFHMWPKLKTLPVNLSLLHEYFPYSKRISSFEWKQKVLQGPSPGIGIGRKLSCVCYCVNEPTSAIFLEWLDCQKIRHPAGFSAWEIILKMYVHLFSILVIYCVCIHLCFQHMHTPSSFRYPFVTKLKRFFSLFFCSAFFIMLSWKIVFHHMPCFHSLA